MATPAAHAILSRLTSRFGKGVAIAAATRWKTSAFDLLWAPDGDERALSRTWQERKAGGVHPLVLLAPAGDDASRVRVCGPQHPRPIHELPAERVLALLERAVDLHFNAASSMLAREFMRLEDSALPGLRVKELLTPHFVRERLPVSREPLQAAIEGVTDATDWRSLFRALGYRIEQLPKRGYLLSDATGVRVVVHPSMDPNAFGRLTREGALPEGLLLADCKEQGADWGVLTAEGRYRLFQRSPATGDPHGQWLEIDAAELAPEDSKFCLGLLAPASLAEDGWLAAWAREARDFGEELREGLERRLIGSVLPEIARGLGEYLESTGVDPAEPRQLERIKDATLTLVFRFIFLLHVEARGYLPVDAAAYRPRSATVLAEDCRTRSAHASPSVTSTEYWDRLGTLANMIREGAADAGVPAYNGQLFAKEGFPGSELLEDAALPNARLAPALAAIAYDTDEPDAPGLDYAGLQIGHLGAIYEALLSLRLTRAPEDLAYDAKSDIYRPPRAGETPEVTRRDLYWQAEAGGRKAGGVFYTRREFVLHLLEHSLQPALDAHIDRVRETLASDPDEAARQLFEFSVLDPAMGSAHFLTVALDVIADRFARFLAEEPGVPAVGAELEALRRGDDLPGMRPPEDGDLLRRLILKRCIYGVDVDPLAVEVANVTLWLASFVPGLALSWLDGNLKCGDSLIGVANPDVVGRGRQRRSGRSAPTETASLLAGAPVRNAMARADAIQRELADIPDRTPVEVARSKELTATLRRETQGLREVFDLWTAEPLGLDEARDRLEEAATHILADGDEQPPLPPDVAEAVSEAADFAERYRFLHWPLEFPSVFHRKRPGFDVVVGNPPWEEVNVEELAFYALRHPGLRGIKSERERRRSIAELDKQHPDWRSEFEDQKQQLATARQFLGATGGYQLQGAGNTDLYKLFCERYTHLARAEGRLGVVLPRQVFLTKGAEGFRAWLFEENAIQRLDMLLNKKQWAFSMEERYTIALLVMKRVVPEGEAVVLKVTGPSASPEGFEATRASGGVSVPVRALGSARIVPLLPSQRYADLLTNLRYGVEFRELDTPKIKNLQRGASVASRSFPHRELDETQQKHLFQNPTGEGLKVWKGRSFDQYNPHGDGPAGWGNWDDILDFVLMRRVRGRIAKTLFTPEELADPATHPIQQARLAFRDVTNRTNSRTVIACLIPPRTPLTNTAPYLLFRDWRALPRAAVLGVMNSLPFDWMARRYVETHLNYYILEMLTFPKWEDTAWERIGELAARLSCVDGRFAEFAAEAGVEYGPLGESERLAMRAEIDALVARGYGLTADELRFIFTDFTEKAVPTGYREQVVAAFEALERDAGSETR